MLRFLVLGNRMAAWSLAGMMVILLGLLQVFRTAPARDPIRLHEDRRAAR